MSGMAANMLAGVVKGATAAVSVLTAQCSSYWFTGDVTARPDPFAGSDRKLEKQIAQRRRFDAPIEAPLRHRITVGFAVALLLTVFIAFFPGATHAWP